MPAPLRWRGMSCDMQVSMALLVRVWRQSNTTRDQHRQLACAHQVRRRYRLVSSRDALMGFEGSCLWRRGGYLPVRKGFENPQKPNRQRARLSNGGLTKSFAIDSCIVVLVWA